MGLFFQKWIPLGSYGSPETRLGWDWFLAGLTRLALRWHAIRSVGSEAEPSEMTAAMHHFLASDAGSD